MLVSSKMKESAYMSYIQETKGVCSKEVKHLPFTGVSQRNKEKKLDKALQVLFFSTKSHLPEISSVIMSVDYSQFDLSFCIYVLNI